MIYISAEDWHRGAFRAWMRTGVWPNTPPAGLFSRKYNHWHDAEDGRFAFTGSGRHDGTPSRRTSQLRRGGGSFGATRAGTYVAQPIRAGSIVGWGGGGSSGGGGPNWENTPGPMLRALMRAAQAEGELATPPSTTPLSPASPSKFIRRNGYEFRLDPAGRTRQVSGNLSLIIPHPRSRTLQARAGLPDRRSTDDGGHYIAPRFNGPSEVFNHFAQDSNFNRGRYRAIEDEWAKAKRTGMKVTVKIVPYYDGSSRRPSEIDIYWNAAGWAKSVKIPNRRQESPRVRR